MWSSKYDEDGSKPKPGPSDGGPAIFQNSHKVSIQRSNFTINSMVPPPPGLMDNLLKHISVNAMHSSQDLKQSKEIDHGAVDAVVHEWSRFEIMPTSSFARVTADDALRDIFKWLHDHLTSFLVMWMHGESRKETLFTAYALANILHQRRDLAASFFVSQNPNTDCSSVVPTISYQLTHCIPHTKEFITGAIQDNIIFTAAHSEQVSKLIVQPLKMVSEFSPAAQKLILIHGLEDCDDEDFQASLLDSLSHELASIETTSPPRLLIIGKYTDHLQKCFSKLLSSSTLSGKIVLRPIHLHNWLGKEHEVSQLLKDVQLRETNLSTMLEDVIAERAAAGQVLKMVRVREEALKQRMEEFEQKQVEQLGKELKTRLEEVEKREQKLKSHEEELATQEKKILEKENELKLKEEAANAKILERQRELKEKEEQLRVREQEPSHRMAQKSLEQGPIANSNPFVNVYPGNSQRREPEVNEMAPERISPVIRLQEAVQMEIKALEQLNRQPGPISRTGSPSLDAIKLQDPRLGSPPYTALSSNPSSSPLQSLQNPSSMFDPTSMLYQATSPGTAVTGATTAYMPHSSNLSFTQLLSPPQQSPPLGYNPGSPSQVTPVFGYNQGMFRTPSPSQASPRIPRSTSPQPPMSVLPTSQPYVQDSRPYFIPEV